MQRNNTHWKRSLEITKTCGKEKFSVVIFWPILLTLWIQFLSDFDSFNTNFFPQSLTWIGHFITDVIFHFKPLWSKRLDAKAFWKHMSVHVYSRHVGMNKSIVLSYVILFTPLRILFVARRNCSCEKTTTTDYHTLGQISAGWVSWANAAIVCSWHL
jgi:hypothetical protein